MCRRNQLVGVALAAFGLGLLLAAYMESGFVCGCFGVIAIGLGILTLQKK